MDTDDEEHNKGPRIKMRNASFGWGIKVNPVLTKDARSLRRGSVLTDEST